MLLLEYVCVKEKDEPKTHKETELVTNKFMVTEEDHAEMIQLAKRNSPSPSHATVLNKKEYESKYENKK